MRKILKTGLVVLFVLIMGYGGWPSGSAYAQSLDAAQIRQVLNEELSFYRQALKEKNTNALINRVSKFTHDQSIFFFELDMTFANIQKSGLPPLRHHFNREPFLVMMENARYLNADDFDMTYDIGDIKIQYDGKEAIFFLKGTTRGSVNEPVSGMRFTFVIDQECRNTVRAHAVTYLQYDSIACRLRVNYQPYNMSQMQQAQDASSVPAFKWETPENMAIEESTVSIGE